jgi:hypothetical protein
MGGEGRPSALAPAAPEVSARWVSTPLAFAGQLQPRRLNEHGGCPSSTCISDLVPGVAAAAVASAAVEGAAAKSPSRLESCAASTAARIVASHLSASRRLGRRILKGVPAVRLERAAPRSPCCAVMNTEITLRAMLPAMPARGYQALLLLLLLPLLLLLLLLLPHGGNSKQACVMAGDKVSWA